MNDSSHDLILIDSASGTNRSALRGSVHHESKDVLQTLVVTSPLQTSWSPEAVRLWVEKISPGQSMQCFMDGCPVPFQFTGRVDDRRGAEVFVILGFEAGQTKELRWCRADSLATDLTSGQLSTHNGAVIGPAEIALSISAPMVCNQGHCVSGPFAGFAGFPMRSQIFCEQPFESLSLVRTNHGPLFEDYELNYQFAQRRSYTLAFRFWKHETFVEVSERFSLGMNGKITWTLNPDKVFDSILSRDRFENETQPTLEPLSAARVRDVLCRLQMPVLSEYAIPNNRGWFALLNNQDHTKKMFGIMGLHGARWSEPVANMPEIFARDSAVEWHASLASGSRHFLLHTGAVETKFTEQHRFVYHRLHAQFNACRLDEHLDLSGDLNFDENRKTSFFPDGNYHIHAADRVAAYPSLQRTLANENAWMKQNGSMHLANFHYLLEPSAQNARALCSQLIARFEKWVRQFQGWRVGEHDYMKNVIGFSRFLRGLLLGYEMLQRDSAITHNERKRLNAYFIFAARRIVDEGRWPHSHTWQHPDHPQSTRDFYTYGGEHKPDRLIWTNCLPNFQSDPMCALAHLSAVFQDHPDAAAWRRFALEDIDRQLDAYCGKSGAWQESINYALYTFSYFTVTFKALREHCGINYFEDERVRRYASWLVHFLGPIDKRWNKFTFPGVGNAVCPSGGGEYLLSFAGELAIDDPLRADLISVWQRLEPSAHPNEHFPVVMATMAPLPQPPIPLRPLQSECMDEVGIALRDRHTLDGESFLLQKIGFAKDHYEADETSFNWYAKGTPMCMDYGTYTSDVGVAGAHNLVEIPDADPLRRGYLKAHHFTPLVDFTHCEVPVTLKLLWGKVRSFEEVENKDGKIDQSQTPYFYIGDNNPVGPKVWKVRLMLFVKPDYIALFDRVIGDVPHRYNLHLSGKNLRIAGNQLHAQGDFDLDMLGLIQHPNADALEHEIGRLVPNINNPSKQDESQKHAQGYWRLYNRSDGVYRTLLFAKERQRQVTLAPLGKQGIRVTTPQYTDFVFLGDEHFTEQLADPLGPIAFSGKSGWIRRTEQGHVQAMLIDGDMIEAFGTQLRGRGAWSYNMDENQKTHLLNGAPRQIHVNVVR